MIEMAKRPTPGGQIPGRPAELAHTQRRSLTYAGAARHRTPGLHRCTSLRHDARPAWLPAETATRKIPSPHGPARRLVTALLPVHSRTKFINTNRQPHTHTYRTSHNARTARDVYFILVSKTNNSLFRLTPLNYRLLRYSGI